MSRIATVLSSLVLAACAGRGASPTSPPASFADRMVAAHGGPGWYEQPAIASDLEVEFGGAVVLAGAMVFEPRTGRCRIDLADGGVMLFDGREAWATGGVPMPRFHVLTWPYFLGVPWKLGDPGAALAVEHDRPLGGVPHPTARLTFAAGTGDTPDDWYVLYADPQSHRLAGLAYIVTYGKTRAEAEEHPSLALYGDWTEVAGLLLPGELVLQPWSDANDPDAEPPDTEPKGRATFADLRVVVPAADAFTPPPGAVRDALPE